VALCYGWIDGQKRPESPEACCRDSCRVRQEHLSKIKPGESAGAMAGGEMKAAGLEAVRTPRRMDVGCSV